MHSEPDHFIAFEGVRRLTEGSLSEILPATKAALQRNTLPVLVFNNQTGAQVELDLRGGPPAAPGATPVQESRGRGRPKLGVVAREVTLLPRHWEWLNSQPGGASVALRKLVEKARSGSRDTDRVRQAREACYKFMSAMAGDQPGFEEASRALFAGNRELFETYTSTWPEDVRNHARKLAGLSWPE